MFDFLFKRPARTAEKPSIPVSSAVASPSARDQALAQAHSLDSDEAAAVAFILQCEFSEARLLAAQQVQSRAALEQVQQALRNTDRRVSKLMQARLEVLAQQQRAAEQAQDCIVQAQQLIAEAQLTPNQVAYLDRSWQAIDKAPADLINEFGGLRQQLRLRLEAQASLQRALLDVQAALTQLLAAQNSLDIDADAQRRDTIAQQLVQYAGAAEAPALPRHLLSDCQEQLRRLQAVAAERQKYALALQARQQALQAWESSEIASLQAERMQREWRALPPLPQAALLQPLQMRFDTLISSLSALQQQKKSTQQHVAEDLQQHFLTLLESLEQAVQQGALQQAAAHDKSLRGIDIKAARLNDQHSAQLAQARAELARLQGWAKWGGNVSREELLKAALALPLKKTAPLELAKKVGSLRERWKSLDASAGSAPQALWQQFDSACTSAYAPAAEHFAKLAQERQHNAQQAQTLLAGIEQMQATQSQADPAACDWKALANYCVQTRQAWSRLGPMERKEKRRLDGEFERALRALSAPLEAQRQIEIDLREQLIVEAGKLDAQARQTPEQVRSLQERWQQRAKALPLARQDEQALWQRFRSACDAVFAQRKDAAHEADAERKRHLQTKEALCATLEAGVHASEAEINRILRDTRDAWRNAGPVPRAQEKAIEARYQAASSALQQALGAGKAAALAAQGAALQSKLLLCQRIEQALVNGVAADVASVPAATDAWRALATLPGAFEKKLRSRFDAVVTALQADDRQYAACIEENSRELAQTVLALEIAEGLETPPELAQQRMALQITLLQSSLKSGQKGAGQTVTPELQQLLTLPALADAALLPRVEKLLSRLLTPRM